MLLRAEVMRLGYVFAVIVAVGLSSAPVMALNQKDVADCDQEADSDRSIAGCTRLIEFGNLTNQVRTVAYFQRGNAWYHKGELDHAIADYDETIRLHGWTGSNIDPVVIKTRQGVYTNRGLAWRDKGDLDRALADQNEAIRLDPKWYNAHANRGEIWRLKGDMDRAITDQDEAIRLYPKFPLAYVLRGDTLRYKGELDRALPDYDQALRLSPNYIPAFTGRGLTYEKMGDLARAHGEFQKALASPSQLKAADISKSSLETARAHLAALASGAPPGRRPLGSREPGPADCPRRWQFGL
jgi:tetratricopeptide (TPR) repeat protein